MKRSMLLLSALLLTFTGCSNDDDSESKGSGVHSSPTAVVEALFAEAGKEKPDKDAVLELMSSEMKEKAEGQYDEFVKFMSEQKLEEVEKVTTHESGKYAKVHIVLLIDGEEEHEDIPVIKVDKKWYLHTHYGKLEEKTAKSSSE